MSVLIRGMEMPKNCWECPCEIAYPSYGRSVCGVTSLLTDDNGDVRREDCPLIPVPPHGDLIDKQVADELNKKDYEEMGSDIYTDYARSVVLNCLNAAPTIIEAEGAK